jgi:hypothetical protein
VQWGAEAVEEIALLNHYLLHLLDQSLVPQLLNLQQLQQQQLLRLLPPPLHLWLLQTAAMEALLRAESIDLRHDPYQLHAKLYE